MQRSIPRIARPSCLLLGLLCLLLIRFAGAQDLMPLPQGQVGTAYSAQIKTEGGLSPLAWRLVGGELPAGLSVSAGGKLEGTPTAAKRDAYTFTLVVSDSSQPPQTATMQFSIVIKAGQLRITGVSQETATLKIVGANADNDPPPDSPTVAKTGAASNAKPGRGTIEVPSADIAKQNMPANAAPAGGGGNGQSAPQLGQNPCTSGQQPPFLNTTLAAGERTLDGCADGSGVAKVLVGVIPAGPDLTCPDPSKYTYVQARLLAPAPDATGVEFVVQLQSPLTGGQQVCIAEMSTSGVVVKTPQPLPVPSVLAAAPNPCASLKDLPAIPGTLVGGQTSVSGCAESTSTAVQISVIDVNSAVQCSESDAKKFAQKPQPFLVVQDATGSFSQFWVQLSAALTVGQQVCLTEITANNALGKAMANPVIVKSAPAQTADSCETTSGAYFPEPPVTGRKVLTGCAGKAPGARVVVYAKGKINECPASFPVLDDSTVVDNRPANVDPKTGIFQAELTHPLTDDEMICAYAVSADKKPPIVATRWGYDEADSPIGRSRYYLSTGLALSQTNQQFSNQNLYLGFAFDRNWLRGKPDRKVTLLLDSELSAQLTAIPVAASSSTSTTPPSTSSGTTSTQSGTTTTTPSPSSTQSVSTFITSRKAAVVSGAIYAPIYMDAFKGWFGGGTAGFFAPILKGGLQTTTAGSITATSPVPGTTTTTSTVNNADLYYFWSAGLRLGDLRLFRSWNIAPQMLSHLDLTFGQWENFKQCRISTCTTNPDGTVDPNQLYQPVLLSLEGQLNIPKTPVQIGFRAMTPVNGGGEGRPGVLLWSEARRRLYLQGIQGWEYSEVP